MSKQNTVTFRIRERSISAVCNNPRPRCYLTRVFTPLPNLRVISKTSSNGVLDCSVIIARHEPATNQNRATVLDVCRQVCAQCQKQRQK